MKGVGGDCELKNYSTRGGNLVGNSEKKNVDALSFGGPGKQPWRGGNTWKREKEL